MKVVALIPARGGSKGVPKKNLQLLAGHPLLAYTIVAAAQCNAIDRLILTTDSEEIGEMGKKYGAEVPFLRPASISQDRSTDAEYVLHCLDWLEKHEGQVPEWIVQLRPTTPLRNPRFMAEAVEKMKSHSEATSMRSAHELAESPHKMLQIEGDYLTGFFPNDPRPEYFNLPRQLFPKAYHPNGYVDILKVSFVRKSGTLYGSKILPWVTPFSIEVDTQEDVERLRYEIQRVGSPLLEFLEKIK